MNLCETHLVDTASEAVSHVSTQWSGPHVSTQWSGPHVSTQWSGPHVSTQWSGPHVSTQWSGPHVFTQWTLGCHPREPCLAAIVCFVMLPGMSCGETGWPSVTIEWLVAMPPNYLWDIEHYVCNLMASIILISTTGCVDASSFWKVLETCNLYSTSRWPIYVHAGWWNESVPSFVLYKTSSV